MYVTKSMQAQTNKPEISKKDTEDPYRNNSKFNIKCISLFVRNKTIVKKKSKRTSKVFVKVR
jgi:hypothetical protein